MGVAVKRRRSIVWTVKLRRSSRSWKNAALTSLRSLASVSWENTRACGSTMAGLPCALGVNRMVFPSAVMVEYSYSSIWYQPRGPLTVIEVSGSIRNGLPA